MNHGVAELEGDGIAGGIAEGEHVVAGLAVPSAFEHEAVAEDNSTALAPELDFDREGDALAVADFFANVGVIDMGGEDGDDVAEVDLLAGIGVEMLDAIGPAAVAVVTGVMLPEDVFADVVHTNFANRLAAIGGIFAEGHLGGGVGAAVLAGSFEGVPEASGASVEGVFEWFVFAGAIVAWFPRAENAVVEVGAIEFAVNALAGAREAEGGVIHGGEFDIDEAGATDGAELFGGVAVEEGGEAGETAFGDVFEEDVGVIEAGLGAGPLGGKVGKFTGNGATVEDVWVGYFFAGEDVASGAEIFAVDKNEAIGEGGCSGGGGFSGGGDDGGGQGGGGGWGGNGGGWRKGGWDGGDSGDGGGGGDSGGGGLGRGGGGGVFAAAGGEEEG